MMLKICFVALAMVAGCMANIDASDIANNIRERVARGEDLQISAQDLARMSDAEIAKAFTVVMESENLPAETILKMDDGTLAQFLAGRAGRKGNRGTHGNAGPSGPHGPPGHDGPPGLRGSFGPQGFPGPQGLAGFKGPKGFPGPQGVAGKNVKLSKKLVNRILTAEYMLYMYKPYMNVG